MGFISENRPDDWPVNGREQRLDIIWDKLDEFERNPSYRTRELLLAFVNDNDRNQFTSFGEMRFTDYEAELINLIYVRASQFQINSVKAYLYDLITEATRLQKINSWTFAITGRDEGSDSYRIKPYENILLLPLKLYHLAYQKYTVEKTAPFAEQILDVVNGMYDISQGEEMRRALASAFTSMLNDMGYMRGSRKEKLWEFNRDELLSLFEVEARILKGCGRKPVERPTRGVLMTQLSSFILKSRNDYNQDYICKYLKEDAAKRSVKNHEIWMRQTKDLNDEREQRVIPELFLDESWIDYPWATQIDFTPVRTYFVSSFSKTINASNMQDEYGSCIYGYKNDRIAELLAPLMLQPFQKLPDADKDLPDEKCLPAISQVITFDVIYDRDDAKQELQYLFKIIDLFDMSNDEKHAFLQDILQYWILTVKDEKWRDERERRYVLFLYDEYNYLELTIENGFLKEKTSLFLLPDFLLGNNPVKNTVKREMESKQKGTMTREYLHCTDCLVQDYDSLHEGIHPPTKCPICGSKNIELIYPPKENE